MQQPTFRAAAPDNRRNQLVMDLTRTQLQQAQELARESGHEGEDLVPALLVALALNYNSQATAPKA